ncbi:uncharacterized protein [Lolium perenne]|uniref:uncharacterized protein n=1 Tax=Lolium perenne TaxID=4522 RepID=UPI0021F632CA|nr:uncharacterized protein LOC127318018 [Lolium perenne]
MPCSSSSSSGNDDDPDYRVDSSDDDQNHHAATTDDDNDAAAVVLPAPPDAEGVVSFLRTQDEVDALCQQYGVPKDQYTARSAGDLRASSSPPPGAVCVYAHALEAGMRVPLHPFYRDALAHFGIAPTQLAPNGWRIMAGFLVLCRSAGVPPSIAVFRYFFGCLPLFSQKNKRKGWYFFRARDASLCFAGLPHRNTGWKHGFFFLSSPEPWTCPVEWGEPPTSSLVEPVLNGEEEKMAAKLLEAHDAAPVDLRTYLCESNLVAAMISPASPVPATPPTCVHTTAGSEGMDPLVYGMMKSIRAENAAASASKVKSEAGSDAPSCGKKRSLKEAFGEEGRPSPVLPSRRPAAHGISAPAGACSPPPGFSRKPTRVPNGHSDDGTDWEAARELLRGAVAPPLERVFAASKPSDVVASCNVEVLKAVNYAMYSSAYALELEEKLAARDTEVAALQDQLKRAKAELAVVKDRRRT